MNLFCSLLRLHLYAILAHACSSFSDFDEYMKQLAQSDVPPIRHLELGEAMSFAEHGVREEGK